MMRHACARRHRPAARSRVGARLRLVRTVAARTVAVRRCAHAQSMPELPDIVVYCETLGARVRGQRLDHVRIVNPFVLRTAVPPLSSVEKRRVIDVRRLGKRIVLALEAELFIVIHLMVAGRLRWLGAGKRPPGRITLALLEFSSGTLALTEAGTKRRASMHVVQGPAALAAFDAGGLEVGDASATTFAARLRA